MGESRMLEAERKALLELWELVPGCRPVWGEDSFEPTAYAWRVSGIGLVPDEIVAALARDAIEEWLLKQKRSVTQFEDDDGSVLCSFIGQPERTNGGYVKPTRLLALISAAKAVHEGSK